MSIYKFHGTIIKEAKTFTYGNATWGDLLTKINGTAVTSDAIGNILSDGTSTYTWKNGRQLATSTKNGVTWTYTYDTNGMRTARTNGSTPYTYTYDGTTLAQMTVGSNTLIFAYGSNGHPMGVRYNGTEYNYVTNAFGDVIAIADNSGNELVTYSYDAWGNLLSTTGSMASTLGAHNPLRYRGYVYDQETGLYYLQSRYYNPRICRFINADSFVSTGQGILGHNMFAYCLNNPVSRIDISGAASISVTTGEELPWNDMLSDNLGSGGGAGGGSFYNSFVRTLQSAANGLNMATGQRNMSVSEKHHIFSDKSKVYTPQFKEIADRYDMALNSEENRVSLPGHHGRHTTAYHEFMLCTIISLDYLSAGSKALFYKGMEIIAEFIANNPVLQYSK